MTTHDQADDPAARVVSTSAKLVRIGQLSPAALVALADGDGAAASEAAGLSLLEDFTREDWRRLWRRRSEQVLNAPGSATWITGVIWDVQRNLAVGCAGFHGPPDDAGMVEIGYDVVPAHRRQGYARAALQSLLDRAAREVGVHTVRVTVSPGNAPSQNLIAQFGFAQVGEQWDDEDGLEIVYEVNADVYR